MLVEIWQIQLKWQSSRPVYISKVSPCTCEVSMNGRHKNQQKMPTRKSYCPDKYNITWIYLYSSAKSTQLYIQYYGVYRDLNKKHAMCFVTTVRLLCILILCLLCCVDGKITPTGTLRFQLYSVVTGYKPATCGFYFIQNIATVF